MSRKIYANGIDYSTRRPLIPAIDEEEFAKQIQQSLFNNSVELQRITEASASATMYKSVMTHKVIDLGDPKEVGWTYLINEDDSNKKEIIETIEPLARHRGMADPKQPLTIGNLAQEKWQEWLTDNYNSLILYGKKCPHYVLIVGSPEQVPFKFQSLLDSAASVGRLDLPIDGLEKYVRKVIALETSSEASVRKEAVVFAPDGGGWDPALFCSCYYLAEPIANHVAGLGYKVTKHLGKDASKPNLNAALREGSPAMVFTASHGLGAPDQPLEVQKKVNGAICCQESRDSTAADPYFTADDVPKDETAPFLEGSVFFQFACYGYGTPANSDFSHWVQTSDVPATNASADFIAALPKELLAHSRGPVLYIGHVDVALMDGYDDPKHPIPEGEWHPRIAPYISAINTLLKDANPAGPAMLEMNKRYDISNAMLSFIFDKLKRNKITPSPEFFRQITDTFIVRTDAQNYMVFGDPAVSLKIESNEV